MKKLLCALLALTLVFGMSISASALEGIEPFEGDPIHLTFGFDGTGYEPDSTTWPKEIFNAIKTKLNVDLEFVSIGDSQQYQVMLAGGDLPDMIKVLKEYLTQCIDGGLIIPMDDYLEYAPHLKELSPLREAVMRNFNSDGTGKWYVWTPQVGPATKDPYEWNGYTVRWDWYKELGAPAITDQDSFIDYIKTAVEAHPTTEDGKKVWGYGLWNDLWAYYIPGAVYNGGWTNINEQYHINYVDSRVVNAFYEDDGPIWPQIEFCYKLNQLGLFDPDSFTMTGDDYTAKVSEEQYAAIACQWYDGLYSVKRLEDPETLAGYVVLPVEGLGYWSHSIEYVGWNFFYGISANCADPVAAIKVYDWMNTEEGCRWMMTGDQGRIWDYDADGKAYILPEAQENRNTMTSDEWSVWGGALWDGIPGISKGAVLSDGYMGSLWYERDAIIANLRPIDKDYAAFYGKETPYDVIEELINEGKATDQSKYMRALVGLLGTPPTEIIRIDNNCTEIFKRTLPDLVLAADDDTFASVKAGLLQELEDAGVQESMDWWYGQAAEGRAFVEANS